jgi:hypothetical protein
VQTKKVFKLDDDFVQAPFRLIGVGATLKYYVLCHHLNNLWQIDFTSVKPIVVTNSKGKKAEFFTLQSTSEDGKMVFTMFVNKEAGQFLLPEAANYDFILKVEGALEDEDIKTLCAQIGEVKGVLLSAEIPLEKTKNTYRLILPEAEKEEEV